MKVVYRTDKMPTVFIVSGLAMATVSQLSSIEEPNRPLLFAAGWIIAGFGFVLWAVPTLKKWIRKRERARTRAMRETSSDRGEQPRRYARPRR
mgnify:CR=1 FL=1